MAANEACAFEGQDHLVDRRRGHAKVALHLPFGGRAAMHARFVDAIEKASPDEAERKMRKHLRLIMDDLSSIEAQHPDFFTPA
ncbi:hypothetical protein ACFFWD_23130 [Bradyrhizobium erythrophlei]|uniref:hypothetical protein n=1 Tax=Bradyrhizobium erythrophlei TaxID=1437360 RepID=UPI0035E5808F